MEKKNHLPAVPFLTSKSDLETPSGQIFSKKPMTFGTESQENPALRPLLLLEPSGGETDPPPHPLPPTPFAPLSPRRPCHKDGRHGIGVETNPSKALGSGSRAVKLLEGQEEHLGPGGTSSK